jgi:hypothetical protein
MTRKKKLAEKNRGQQSLGCAVRRGRAVVYNDMTIAGRRVMWRVGSCKKSWQYALRFKADLDFTAPSPRKKKVESMRFSRKRENAGLNKFFSDGCRGLSAVIGGYRQLRDINIDKKRI